MTSGISKGWWVACALAVILALGWIKTSSQMKAVRSSQAPARQQNEVERTKQAILRVMKADERLGQRSKTAQPNPTVGQLAVLIGQYCDAVERLDMSDCPADFRVAYKQHMRAWRAAHDAVKQLPDGLLEGALMGFFNGLTRGEQDGGMGRLEGNVRRSEERIRTTWEEVERIAAKYGAAL